MSSGCQTVIMSVCQHVNMSICQYVNTSISQYVNMSICQYVSMSICLWTAKEPALVMNGVGPLPSATCLNFVLQNIHLWTVSMGGRRYFLGGILYSRSVYIAINDNFWPQSRNFWPLSKTKQQFLRCKGSF